MDILPQNHSHLKVSGFFMLTIAKCGNGWLLVQKKKVMSNQFKQYFNNIEQARNLRNCYLFIQMKDMQPFKYVKLIKFEALKRHNL